jgi:hypothetical protein
MPKLELKPWKLNEPQVVFVTKDGSSRIIVEFRRRRYFEMDTKIVRITNHQHTMKDETWETMDVNEDCEDYLDYTVFRDFIDEQEFLNLLGVPETLEEENDV